MLLVAAALALLASSCDDSDASDDDTQAPDDTRETSDTGDGDAQSDTLVTYTEDREPCADRNATRNPYFGDLHVHTRWSFDAWVEGTRPDPADSYRFAQGDPIDLPPLDADGNGTQRVQLARPLDFMAVTDHAEYLGEVDLCTDASSPVYDSTRCQSYREMNAQSIGDFGTQLTNENPQRLSICDDADCVARGDAIWGRIQQDAEDAYDRTAACEFTSLIAYEWSATTAGRNHHRNVIFRNDTVPAHPTSYIDEPTAEGLWDALERDCLDAGNGCEVLAIPHNSNLSNGGIFTPLYPGATSLDDERTQAEQRARLEPLVEIFQHKGNSECNNELSGIMGEPDELCLFEQINPPPYDECAEGQVGALGIRGDGCTSRYDYVRSVLLEGLSEAQRLGVNPYQLGVIGSTDTHAAIGGYTDETDWRGHMGLTEDEVSDRLSDDHLVTYGIVANPGGLAGVWAVENSRDAIFEALARRETFGTSGTRIVPRLFGGWEYADGLCGEADLVDQGYASGVPMGGTLPAPPEGGATPRFVVHALRDPDTDRAAPLERIQIVKGWMSDDGALHYEVFHVAGDDTGAATVDTATCERSGGGSDTLCGVWEDPDFDPNQHAYYYARVVETPSCRWSTLQCNALPEADRPPECSAGNIPKTIQEMAWTSPIWYRP